MMQKMLLIIVLLTVSNLVVAQNSKRNRIKELLTVMHQDTFLVRKFQHLSRSESTDYTGFLNDSTVSNAFLTYVEDSSLRNDMKAIMKDTAYVSLISAMKNVHSAKKKITNEQIDKLANQFMNENLVDLYDKKFSTDEIDEMINFYKTSTGQKLLSVMPGIQQDIEKRIEKKYIIFMQRQ